MRVLLSPQWRGKEMMKKMGPLFPWIRTVAKTLSLMVYRLWFLAGSLKSVQCGLVCSLFTTPFCLLLSKVVPFPCFVTGKGILFFLNCWFVRVEKWTCVVSICLWVPSLKRFGFDFYSWDVFSWFLPNLGVWWPVFLFFLLVYNGHVT